MNYDISKPESLPLALSQHVIVDLRTGATFTAQTHRPHEAIASLLREMTGITEAEPEPKGFTPEDTKEIVQFAVDVMKVTVLRMAKKSTLDRYHRDGIVQVGPFVTWDECLHNKNTELMTQRMERFATGNLDSGGPVPAEQIDLDIAKQMRTDITTQREIIAKEKANTSPDPLDEIMSAIFGDMGMKGGRF